MLVGTIIILAYEKFEIGFFSRICLISLIPYLLYAIICCAILKYYLTEKGPIVKRGGTFYSLSWDDILMDEYKERGTICEKILGCRTFEFTRSYMTSAKKDAWKEKARFWTVRDYEKARKIIRLHLQK